MSFSKLEKESDWESWFFSTIHTENWCWKSGAKGLVLSLSYSMENQLLNLLWKQHCFSSYQECSEIVSAYIYLFPDEERLLLWNNLLSPDDQPHPHFTSHWEGQRCLLSRTSWAIFSPEGTALWEICSLTLILHPKKSMGALSWAWVEAESGSICTRKIFQPWKLI